MGVSHRVTIEVNIDPVETSLSDTAAAVHRAADVIRMMTVLPEDVQLAVITFDGDVPDATITYADVRPKYVPF